MNTVFTAEEKLDALDFAYAMGLTAPASSEETGSALDFARSMGLRVRSAAEKKPARRAVNRIPVPALRFI